MNYADYFAYRQSDHWREMRRLAIEHAEHRCQLCNAAGNLEVHHRTYERLGRERLADLIALCADCHRWHHGHTRERHHIKARSEGITEPSVVVPIIRYDALVTAADALWSISDAFPLGDINKHIQDMMEEIDSAPGVHPYRAD